MLRAVGPQHPSTRELLAVTVRLDRTHYDDPQIHTNGPAIAITRHSAARKSASHHDN
jgi:hypothetical protein